MPSRPPEHPDISVLIATYNYGSLLGRALGSLNQQTLPPEAYEVIVIDDGSTDQTPAIAEKYKDCIRYFQRPHGGLPAACNFGIRESHAPYLVRVDADDTVAANFLEREWVAFRQHSDAGFVYCDRFDVNDGKPRRFSIPEGNLYDCIAVGIMFRTQDLRALGGYRNYFWEEYDLFLRFLERFPEAKPFHLSEPLYNYWRHAGSMVSDPERRLEGWKALLNEWGPQKLKCLGHLEEVDQAIAFFASERVGS